MKTDKALEIINHKSQHNSRLLHPQAGTFARPLAVEVADVASSCLARRGSGRRREGGRTRKRGEGEEGGVYRPAHFPVSFPRPSPRQCRRMTYAFHRWICALLRRFVRHPNAFHTYPVERTHKKKTVRRKELHQHYATQTRYSEVDEVKGDLSASPNLAPTPRAWQDSSWGVRLADWGGGGMPKATEPRGSSGGSGWSRNFSTGCMWGY